MADHFFSGNWHSKFHPLSIQFNENVWRLINDGHDNQEGALFGLFSENDGASFSLDYALKDPKLEYDYEFAEAEFFSRMFNLDNQCQRLESVQLNIDEFEFTCNRYLFHNQKFGAQRVLRAMHINQDFIIAIGMAWPEQSESEQILIPKFRLLTEHLKLRNEY